MAGRWPVRAARLDPGNGGRRPTADFLYADAAAPPPPPRRRQQQHAASRRVLQVNPRARLHEDAV
ncbi:hypothetical protein PAHAL_7G239300 [Panicum hallii]|uniref:Uncharacterized protein n=1 Tax=Panicum hallii TaxID=206008 RepID=A0A2T8IDB0_9POAL|nr:hypothetical protein PAHAL_7G239300 [Panicum hallii]